ncbi:hypothetical protein HA402_000445 [Bradysia odoriphaga]|nr:hypothetical protein HA402_000445 [Bradysia odoriphaga]
MDLLTCERTVWFSKYQCKKDGCERAIQRRACIIETSIFPGENFVQGKQRSCPSCGTLSPPTHERQVIVKGMTSMATFIEQNNYWQQNEPQ